MRLVREAEKSKLFVFEVGKGYNAKGIKIFECFSYLGCVDFFWAVFVYKFVGTC
jgi:hypothetical protein